MALKDLLQSQKTIRELKTETAALRLEKEEAARQKEKMPCGPCCFRCPPPAKPSPPTPTCLPGI